MEHRKGALSLSNPTLEAKAQKAAESSNQRLAGFTHEMMFCGCIKAILVHACWKYPIKDCSVGLLLPARPYLDHIQHAGSKLNQTGRLGCMWYRPATLVMGHTNPRIFPQILFTLYLRSRQPWGLGQNGDLKYICEHILWRRGVWDGVGVDFNPPSGFFV